MQAGVPNIRSQPPSGPANHVIQVYRELQNLGNQLFMLARMDDRIWVSTDLKDFSPVEIPDMDRGFPRLFERAVRRFQSLFQLPYAAYFESQRFASACLKELDRCDLLYERMGWFGYGGAIAARRLNIPLVLEVNGDHLSELELSGYQMNGLQKWLSCRLVNFAIQQATLIVATGEGWQKRFIERWKVEPGKVVVVENGTEIVSLLDREQLKSFHPDTAPYSITIAYVGAFEPWHGIQVLIRAVTRLTRCGIKLRLLLIGSGPEQQKIEALIRECGIGDSVIFTGPLSTPQMAAYLRQADIGVSPYCGRVEFSGLKLLDYKAAGLATVASGANGEPAVIAHGKTGLIVPPCDEEALANALYELSTDTPRLKQIGRNARLEAERLHSWSQTARILDELFKTIIR